MIPGFRQNDNEVYKNGNVALSAILIARSAVWLQHYYYYILVERQNGYEEHHKEHEESKKSDRCEGGGEREKEGCGEKWVEQGFAKEQAY